MRPVPEPSPLRVKLAPFPERIAQYPKALPNAWINEGERRPPAWNASGQALVPECLLPTPLREITTVSVAPDGTVAIGGPDGLAALEHGRWRYYAGQRWLPSNDVLDGGNGGRTKEDGTFFLLPYWMARYHGLFEEGRAPAPRLSRRRR
jgi:hypothetical protein